MKVIRNITERTLYLLKEHHVSDLVHRYDYVTCFELALNSSHAAAPFYIQSWSYAFSGWPPSPYLGSYLRCSKERSLSIGPQAGDLVLRALVDSNRRTRFSVSAAVFDFMGSIVQLCSKTKLSVFMSSTEAELCAACVSAHQISFFLELLADLSLPGVTYPASLRK